MTAEDATPSRPKRRLSAFASVVALGLLVLGGIGALQGMGWSLSLGLAAGGVLIFLGLGRPLFRIAIDRPSAQEVRCRFVPWYQANTLLTSVMFPIIGLVMIVQGREAGSPFWLRYGGYFIVVFGVAAGFLALFQSTNRLSFTPASLWVRIGRRFEIPRERVVAIKPRMFTSTGTGKTTRHWDLVYVPAGGGANRIMPMLDRQFSVEPDNLGAALQAWKDGDSDEPGLMDRVEALLRRQAPRDG